MAIAPDSSKANLTRGIFYTQQEEWDLALQDLNRAIKLDPENPQAYFSRGNVYTLQKKWEQATADYERALELNPNDFQVQISLKNIQQQATDAANTNADDLTQSVEYNNSGLAHALKQEFTEALENFNRAMPTAMLRKSPSIQKILVYILIELIFI